MTDHRRYSDDEVKEIFETATDINDPGMRSTASSEGLSLAEVQEIGREVGVAPERIAEAASRLDLQVVTLPKKTYLGMPLSVGRTVDLQRAPTDREWELLVSELRETFQARGTIESHGGLRHWYNGNLHAYIEPTESGYRLRMGTLKGNALAAGGMGLFGIAMGLFVLLALFAKGRIESEFLIGIFFMIAGVGAIAAPALRLPSWAREREEQMEHIAARAQALVGADPDSGGS